MLKKWGGEEMEEVFLGNKKYLYKSEDGKDCLLDHSDNGVKINISFSKNPEKNSKAREGLKHFFTDLYSV